MYLSRLQKKNGHVQTLLSIYYIVYKFISTDKKSVCHVITANYILRLFDIDAEILFYVNVNKRLYPITTVRLTVK